MFTRWLTVFLVAIGLGVAALEIAASPAGQASPPWSFAATSLLTDAGGPGVVIDSTEVSALPRFTE